MVPLQVSESKERNITSILPTYNYMYIVCKTCFR